MIINIVLLLLYYTNICIIYIACFCRRTPNVLRMLMEREEKGLEMAFESWERKTIVYEVGRKWVPVWWAGLSKCTFAVCGQFDMRDVQVTTVSWSQVASIRNARDRLAESGQVSRSHVVQTPGCRLWTELGQQRRPASVAHFTRNCTKCQ